MKNNEKILKNAPFGGFDKADVLLYIEKLQQEKLEIKKRLREVEKEKEELERKLREKCAEGGNSGERSLLTGNSNSGEGLPSFGRFEQS